MRHRPLLLMLSIFSISCEETGWPQPEPPPIMITGRGASWVGRTSSTTLPSPLYDTLRVDGDTSIAGARWRRLVWRSDSNALRPDLLMSGAAQMRPDGLYSIQPPAFPSVMRRLHFPAEVGDTVIDLGEWQLTDRFGTAGPLMHEVAVRRAGEVTLDLPAGRFTAFPVEFIGVDLHADTIVPFPHTFKRAWIALGVGVVKAESDSGRVWELVEHVN